MWFTQFFCCLRAIQRWNVTIHFNHIFNFWNESLDLRKKNSFYWNWMKKETTDCNVLPEFCQLEQNVYLWIWEKESAHNATFENLNLRLFLVFFFFNQSKLQRIARIFTTKLESLSNSPKNWCPLMMWNACETNKYIGWDWITSAWVRLVTNNK